MKNSPIVFVINRLAVGGAERVLVEDINEFIARGEDVYLITLRPEKKETLSFSCDIPLDKWTLVNFNSLLHLRAWWRFVTILRNINSEVVISHLWFANYITRIGGFLAGVTCRIAFEQNVYDEVKTKKQFLMDRVLQYMTTKIVAVSDTVQASLIKHGIKKKKIVVLHNAINIRKFHKSVDTKELRRELGLNDTDFIFLTIGRLTKQKAHDVLLRAFMGVQGKLLIIGEGEDEEYLKKLCEKLHISSRVYFLGVKQDVPSFLNAADCFVFPSRWEGMSIVMIEALASGLPLIVSDFPAANEIITDNENGIIVSIDSHTELATAMNRIQHDEILQKKLSSNAIKTANKFSIGRHVDSLLDIIKRNLPQR